MDIDGGNNQRLTWTGLSSTAPSWSPDGDALAITHRSCGGCVPRPHILTIATGTIKELPWATLGYGGSNLSWSHGDSLLAMRSGSGISVSGFDDSLPVEIVSMEYAAGQPRFSPSGDRIVFSANLGHWPDGSSRVDIFIVDKDGQNLSQISPGWQPSWSPDGTEIVYSLGGNLWIMSAEGTNTRQLTFFTDFTDGIATDPSWYN